MDFGSGDLCPVVVVKVFQLVEGPNYAALTYCLADLLNCVLALVPPDQRVLSLGSLVSPHSPQSRLQSPSSYLFQYPHSSLFFL